METDTLFDQQRSWSERGLFLLRELLPLMSPVARFPEWSREERSALGELLSACARSSESTLLLCAYGQVWDAEVTSRSVVEGTLKAIYLFQGQDHFKQRYQEYANDLFLISLLKDHKKAKELLDSVSNPEGREWLPIREKLLTAREVSDIEQQFDRKTRRAMDAKWGFAGLVGELSRSGDPLFSNLAGLCHGYSMASHVIHADTIGTGIALERDLRTKERRESTHLAHLTRLIIDQLVYLTMRLMAGYRYIGHSPAPLIEAQQKIGKLEESFGGIYENWLNIEF